MNISSTKEKSLFASQSSEEVSVLFVSQSVITSSSSSEIDSNRRENIVL